MEDTQWLELLHPFTALKNLYLTGNFALHVFSALSELSGEKVTEILPVLQNLFMSPGYRLDRFRFRKAIKIFVVARRGSGHPVSVHSRPWGGRWRDITEDLVSGD